MLFYIRQLKKFHFSGTKTRRKMFISPIPRNGRRISSSAFLSRRPFVAYLQANGQAMVDLKLWFQSDLLMVTKV